MYRQDVKETHHSLNRPLCIPGFRLNRSAVIQRTDRHTGRSTTNDKRYRICIRRVLGEDACSTLERVGPSSIWIGDGRRHVRQCLDRVECVLVQDSGLVVVLNKDAAAGENVEVWIEVVGISSGEPVHV